MNNFYLSFTQKQELKKRQPQSPKFFDCVSKISCKWHKEYDTDFMENISLFIDHLNKIISYNKTNAVINA